MLKAHAGLAVERISINNCRISSDDAALKFGIASASVTGDIAVSNVVVTNSRYGVALFMQHGGSYDNVRFADMIVQTHSRHASPVSTRETFIAFSPREDFWFIAAARSEDETEIRSG